MPFNEADRIAQARAREQQRAEKEKQQQQDQVKQKILKNIFTEIPITLRSLAEHNYPNIQVVRVKTPDGILHIFTPPVIEKGGWQITTLQTTTSGPYGGDRTYESVYLLSDGQICFKGYLFSQRDLERLDSKDLNRILNGLHNLH